MAPALAVWALGCTDLPFDTGITTSDDLAFLTLQSTAPPPPTSDFTIATSSTTVRQVVHPDPFNSPFLEIRFEANSITGRGDAVFSGGETVTVRVQPAFDTFGFTLSPLDLVFNGATPPRVTFFFGQYGDFAPSDGPAVDAGALAMWKAVGQDQWERVANTTRNGIDQLTGALATPGTYVLASRR